MTEQQAEWTSKVEQAMDYVWRMRRVEVDGELTFTLNILDRVEDETRRLYARMLRETKSTYDTRWADEREPMPDFRMED